MKRNLLWARKLSWSYWKTSRFVVFQFAETPSSAVLHFSTTVAWSHLCNFRLTSHFKSIYASHADFNKRNDSMLNNFWNWKTKPRTLNKPKFYNVFNQLIQNPRENHFHIKEWLIIPINHCNFHTRLKNDQQNLGHYVLITFFLEFSLSIWILIQKLKEKEKMKQIFLKKIVDS